MSAEPTQVEIVGEPAYRVVLERNITNEHSVLREVQLLAIWPEDERAQRAWCLDRVLQRGSFFNTVQDGVDAHIEQAEKFRAYINRGAPE